jgi:serine/threonine protein kinase
MHRDRWAEVERIFHAAAARPAGERAAFVRDACRDDDGLCRDVESLLAQQASASGFLDGPAMGVAAQMVSDVGASVLSGRRLGAYQVHERIGAGGMGEVYRARDSKLGRDVALKILPRVFTGDPDRLARFEREARVLASLNHPHIGAIYGLEDADGIRALVLELVPGKTLADRIACGPIPINDALAIARQMVEALDTAHEKGIVHRDLKPANIKITPDGVVKVLDFGLAKAASADGATDGLTRSQMVTVGGTREGVILGTRPT